MLRPESLQQRLTIFVLLPVALLLIVMGFVGFIYARNSLLAQWREAAILKLQRAAHQVDMRLERTKDWIQFFAETYEGQQTPMLRSWAIEQLKKLESVDHVHLTSPDGPMSDENMFDQQPSPMGHMAGGRRSVEGDRRMMMRRFHSARTREISPPRYDDAADHETVSLISELLDESGQSAGRLEVVLNFDVLIKNIRESGWWQSNKAFLVNDDGRIFASTLFDQRSSLSESAEPIEEKTLQAIQGAAHGTILGEGHPPKEVSGFYKLQQAPWSVVMIAPGKEILAPIVRFRFYYLVIGAGCVFLIVVLIRMVTGGTVNAIKDISKAARRIAGGEFDQPLSVKTQDEVGELTRSFNTMMSQLADRIRIKQALDVAMEVQQNLLPQEMPQIPGLDIAAISLYCDETGGDFYDFVKIHRQNTTRIGIAVGDVSGHGISAALLMATVRAFIKSRVTQADGIAESISSVNRLMTRDTRDSGQFVTLFYTEIYPEEKKMRWVRAGHDPAFLFDPHLDKFEQLQGEGVALGVDPNGKYQENSTDDLSEGKILVVGTDGVWEARNIKDELFGKERLMNIIRQHSDASANDIMEAVIDALKAFVDSAKQEDDITLLVVRFIG